MSRRSDAGQQERGELRVSQRLSGNGDPFIVSMATETIVET
jgi:hypothetical protein